MIVVIVFVIVMVIMWARDKRRVSIY